MAAIMELPYIGDAEIADSAFALREEYWVAVGERALPLCPDDVVWSHLDSRDRLTLDTESTLGRRDGRIVAGKMVVLENGGLICIDSSIVEAPLYPFTVAREIGHWVLHSRIIRVSISNNDLGPGGYEMFSLRANIGQFAETRVGREEWQANRFAVHLLMPDEMVRAEFHKRFGHGRSDYVALSTSVGRFPDQFPDLRSYSRCLASSRENCGSKTMCKRFGVSREAMAIRLEELQLVFASY